MVDIKKAQALASRILEFRDGTEKKPFKDVLTDRNGYLERSEHMLMPANQLDESAYEGLEFEQAQALRAIEDNKKEQGRLYAKGPVFYAALFKITEGKAPSGMDKRLFGELYKVLSLEVGETEFLYDSYQTKDGVVADPHNGIFDKIIPPEDPLAKYKKAQADNDKKKYNDKMAGGYQDQLEDRTQLKKLFTEFLGALDINPPSKHFEL